VMGINLVENFNHPYLATSIGNFWRRWHMSLTSWFRDYVYFPMGGNRVSPARWTLNIATVFLLSGLWHGASWTFVIRGGLHGFYYIFGRITQSWRLSFAERIGLARRPEAGHNGYATLKSLQVREVDAIIAIAVLMLWELWREFDGFAFSELSLWQRWTVYYAACAAVLALGNLGSKQFIYFQF
jgi:D-alanyl-lipoteichoic acid acyltransferase DltB (MBOAT superfamily)